MAHRLDRWRWWLELDAEATLALVQSHPFGKAYALLHESGSLMHDEHGVIAADSWPDVCNAARVNSSFWILSIHDKRVIRVAHGRSGAYVECKYVFFVLDRAALESVTHDDTHQEIEREEATAEHKTRKQPSGAEKRRRRKLRG